MPQLMNCSHSVNGWCLTCVNDVNDKYKDIVRSQRSTIDYLLNQIPTYNPNQCFTLPDGECIAQNCPCLGDQQK